MVHSVPLQRAAQLARLLLRFGQLGLPVNKLNMQVLYGAAQDLHFMLQCLKGGFGGLLYLLFLLLQPPGALLFGNKPPFQFCRTVLKRGIRGDRLLLRLSALLVQPSGEAS
jgi:hypothetical protein